MDQTERILTVLGAGLAASFSFALLVGTWRKGFVYGLACALVTVGVMALLLLPLYLGFNGIRRLS